MPMLDGDDRVTGSSGGILFDDGAVFGGDIFIPVTFWSVRCTKYFQDTTNSANFDWDSSLVCPTGVPSAVRVEGMLAGRFRISTLPQTLIASLFSGDLPPPVISLYITNEQPFGEGYFQVSEFAADVPHDDVANFSCRITSYGPFGVNVSPWVPGF